MAKPLRGTTLSRHEAGTDPHQSEGRPRTVRRILVAADGSASSQAALGVAVELALATGAWTTLACVRAEPDAPVNAPDYAQALRGELRRSRAVIDDATQQVQAAGIEVESEILVGDPAEAIVGLARARSADLIVVGSGGAEPAPAAPGRVARDVLARACCPVLLVKAPRRVNSPQTVGRVSCLDSQG